MPRELSNGHLNLRPHFTNSNHHRRAELSLHTEPVSGFSAVSAVSAAAFALAVSRSSVAATERHVNRVACTHLVYRHRHLPLPTRMLIRSNPRQIHRVDLADEIV